MNELNQQTQTYKPEGMAESPYLKGKEIWDNRIGNARVQAYNQRLAFFCTLGVCLVLVIGIIFQSAKSSVTPYVVEVGKDGEVLAVSKAVHAKGVPTDPQVKYFLSKWITDIRAMPLDPVVKKQAWMNAYSMMRQHAASKMNDVIKKDDPMSKLGEQTISVMPTAIVKMSENTFQVRWNEEVYGKDGTVKESYRMTGLITIEFSQPTTEQELMKNPLGLYVKDFSYTREV
jgi:type IV secretion system protein VirB5